MKPEQVTQAELAMAVGEAKRVPGWNFKEGAVRMLGVGACVVFVVPARKWAHRRAEKLQAQRARVAC